MRKVLFLCLGLVLISGCVAKGTYKEAMEVSESRRTQLEKASAEIESLKKEITSLNEQVSELTASKKDLEGLYAQKEKEASELKAKAEELSSTGLMTAKEVEALKDERMRLVAAEKAKTEEVVSLRAELDALTAQKDYLAREVERLKMKSGELSAEKEQELQKVKSTYEDLVRELKQEIEKGDIRITQAVDRLSVNMVEKILFDSGKAEIKTAGLKVLKRVGDILKGIPDKQIRVEGHTDNVRIGAKIRERYPTNWELSTARATNVVRYLQDKVGIDGKLLSAAGFSENRPVAANDTDEGKAQNRRIEIVLLPLDVDRVLEELKQ